MKKIQIAEEENVAIWLKKGKFTKCMGCQFEKEECDEVKYEKCSFEVTKPNCHRKKMLFTCKIRW